MNSSHLEEVVLNEAGEVYNPINLKMESVIIKGIFCSLGIPLNASVAVTIGRRLRRKPRNIFLLVIILSYLSFFIPPVMELISWGLYEDESLCRSYVAVVVIPQGLLLTNILLAVIERYMAINHPLLHKRKMTPKFACYLIVFSSILTVFILKFVYIVQLGPLRCEMWFWHMKTMAIVLIIQFLSCTTMDIVIYRQTKILLQESRILVPPSDDSRHHSSNNPFSSVTPMSVHVGRKKLSQMGMEATRTLLLVAASLFITPCIALVLIASYFSCQAIYGQLECNHLNGMWHLMKDINLIPAIYTPIIFLVRDKSRASCMLIF